MKGLSKESARWHEVGEEGDAQRVDNYLMRLLKGVPKSHIYRILRSGEVRVNSGRVRPEYRLAPGGPAASASHRSGRRSLRRRAPIRVPAPRLTGGYSA